MYILNDSKRETFAIIIFQIHLNMKFLKVLFILSIVGNSAYPQQPTAKEIIKKANDLMQGQTNESYMQMSYCQANMEAYHCFSFMVKRQRIQFSNNHRSC